MFKHVWSLSSPKSNYYSLPSMKTIRFHRNTNSMSGDFWNEDLLTPMKLTCTWEWKSDALIIFHIPPERHPASFLRCDPRAGFYRQKGHMGETRLFRESEQNWCQGALVMNTLQEKKLIGNRTTTIEKRKWLPHNTQLNSPRPPAKPLPTTFPASSCLSPNCKKKSSSCFTVIWQLHTWF